MAVMEAAFDPAYGEAWNRQQVASALAMPSTRALVIDENGNPIASDLPEASSMKPAGFVLTRKAADEEELLLIAVVPQFRRYSLGTRLAEQLFESAKLRGTASIFLEMRRGNPAIHLYNKLGFKPIGERPGYYKLQNGERVDAVTFGRSL